MRPRYVVLVREGGSWVPQGDGPMTKKTAERVASEIRRDCGVPAKVEPAS